MINTFGPVWRFRATLLFAVAAFPGATAVAADGLVRLQEFAARPSPPPIELITALPGGTPAAAFGHTALRIRGGEEFGPDDLYVDFGVYRPDAALFFGFLRGDARFEMLVGQFAGVATGFDASGQGVVATQLRLSDEQRRAVLRETLTLLRGPDSTYAYHNFQRNCVTYPRDMLQRVTGRKLSLKDPGGTWRSRVRLYSNENFWLRLGEILFFDYRTDLPRADAELIYLPLDLADALKLAGLAGESVVVIPHRISQHRNLGERLAAVYSLELVAGLTPPGLPGFSNQGYGAAQLAAWFVIFALVLLAPPVLKRWPAVGPRYYALVFGTVGLVAWTVALYTRFDFLSLSLTPLLFAPTDYFLWNRNPQRRRLRAYYLAARLLGVCFAAIASLTWAPQDITGSSLVASALLILLAWGERQGLISARAS